MPIKKCSVCGAEYDWMYSDHQCPKAKSSDTKTKKGKGEEEIVPVLHYEVQEENIITKILKGVGLGGLIIGGVGAGLVINILNIIFVWGTGLSIVWFGISLLAKGSILWGLIVLFIGTPVAVGIASFLFPFWIFLFIIGLILGLIRWVF